MSRRMFFLSLLFCVLQSVQGQEEELRFVAGLTEAGFPELAEKVLSRTLEKFPDAASAAPELRIRILIAGRKFDEANTALATRHLPHATQESLWLFLAETAVAANQKPIAEAAYKNYFKTTGNPDAQAIFHYGTLLEERGDDEAAILLYETGDSRPIKSRLAALLAQRDPDRALKLAEDVQLGGLDLWFGSAVVTWARVMIGKQEWDEAQAVLEGQLEILKGISDAVPPSAAPLAGARYLLGLCYEHGGNAAAALTQFYNVYAKYGDSEWGPTAQQKAQSLMDQFETQGRQVKIDLGANQVKMEQSTFSTGRRLFFDRQYAEAVPAIIDALNQYPEGSESITALRELTLSAIHLNDSLTARMVGLYLSERFRAEPRAGDALLAAGKAALDAEKDVLASTLYDLYISGFPQHPRAPAVLYSLAGLRKTEGPLFQIVEAYPDSIYYPRALGRLAWSAFEAQKYETAAERFARYVDTELDPQKRVRARFAFGESFRHLKHWSAGIACFQTLETEIVKARKGFGVSAEMLEFNQPYWEKSVYYQAICQKELGKIDEAVEIFDRFMEQFPRSEIIEQVQFAKANILIENKRFSEALRALDGLAGTVAEPATYYRGVALYETGAYEQSVQTLEKLLREWPASAFTYEAMFVQGRALTAAGRTDDAIRVFGEIMNVVSDDELMHRASLELGRAQTNPSEKLASFQRVALLADPEKHPQMIADALFESLPLYLTLNQPADLLADADRLLSRFPRFGNSERVALLKTKAEQMQMEEITGEHE